MVSKQPYSDLMEGAESAVTGSATIGARKLKTSLSTIQDETATISKDLSR